jgi:outer membrane protein assembly factor BamB
MKHLSILVFSLLFTAAAHAERLVLVSASYGKNVVAICDMNGDVIWQYKTAGGPRGHNGHHDVHLLPNGNILFHDTWTHTVEIGLDKKVVWEYESRTENGNKGKRVDVHAFARLPNGETMIVESGVGRIIHVDKDKKLIKEFPLRRGAHNTRWARMTDKGTYVVSSEAGFVTEYGTDGKVIWEYPIKSRVYGARRLKNGNTLIASGSGKSVIEVNPAKEIVWEIKGKVPGKEPGSEIGLGWMTCVQELDNGNYVIGNCHAGDKNPQIFEITKDKKVVWEFKEWDLVGNGLACWQILDEKQSAMVRKKLAALK